jgi:hypothetical protein
LNNRQNNNWNFKKKGEIHATPKQRNKLKKRTLNSQNWGGTWLSG